MENNRAMKLPPASGSSRWATPALLILCLLIFLGRAQASAPTQLVLTGGSGNIIIEGPSVDAYQIRMAIADTSSGAWKGVRNKGKISAQSGTQVERKADYEFSDGSTVEHALLARIDAEAVDVRASWNSSGDQLGFTRVDFWLPASEAEIATITIGHKVVWKAGKSTGTGAPANPSEIIGTRSSDGTVLFRITGQIVGASVIGSQYRPEQGVTIRIFPVQSPGKARINDVTTQSWRVEFPGK